MKKKCFINFFGQLTLWDHAKFLRVYSLFYNKSMISYIGNLEKLLKRKKRGFWFAPPPLLGFYKSLWFNGFNSLRGQTHAMKFCLRRLMMTVDSGVHSDQPKIFSFFFMAIDYFWLENFDGHAKLCHLSIQIFIRYKNFRLNRTFQRFGEF